MTLVSADSHTSLGLVYPYPACEAPRRWQDDARCKTADPDVFFPPPVGIGCYDAARVICASCPVKAECLAFALENRIPDGMFGGLTPAERGVPSSRRRSRARTCHRCGTEFAGSSSTFFCSDECRNWSRSFLARSR